MRRSFDDDTGYRDSYSRDLNRSTHRAPHQAHPHPANPHPAIYATNL
jgi:hypothetical protein